MKRVTWSEPQLQDPNGDAVRGRGPSFKEITAQWEAQAVKQATDAQFIAKARPGMLAIMELKVRANEPFQVLKPIQYQGSVFVPSENPYATKFVDSTQIIHAGSQLLVKSIIPSTQTWVLEDQNGQEHEISFSEQEKLMFCTDVYQTVESFLKGIEE